MRPNAAPLWEQLVILLLGPPIITAIWWIAARGWAVAVQGGTATKKTKTRQKMEFWAILALMYAVGFGMTVYAWLK
jgi:hypothetical protein